MSLDAAYRVIQIRAGVRRRSVPARMVLPLASRRRRENRHRQRSDHGAREPHGSSRSVHDGPIGRERRAVARNRRTLATGRARRPRCPLHNSKGSSSTRVVSFTGRLRARDGGRGAQRRRRDAMSLRWSFILLTLLLAIFTASTSDAGGATRSSSRTTAPVAATPGDGVRWAADVARVARRHPARDGARRVLPAVSTHRDSYDEDGVARGGSTATIGERQRAGRSRSDLRVRRPRGSPAPPRARAQSSAAQAPLSALRASSGTQHRVDRPC